MRVVSVCVILLAAVCEASNIIKGLYCKDPDTGKLYGVNSTWPSQTFCGNYTCKLRKKNTTETQYAPIKLDISDYVKLMKEDDDMAISPSDNSLVITKKTDNDKQPLFHKDLITKNKNEIFKSNNFKDGDRYLTESEIKSITDMLHTVKKSDLESIVDIYNLAQDIYKEIDTVSTQNLVKETIEAGKLENLERINNNVKNSYWYEPLHHHNKHVDMSHEGTNVKPTNVPPSEINPTFFNGPLTDRDFGKLPYYYPISNFQRLSSYRHPKPSSDMEIAPSETKPCNKVANNYNYLAVPLYGGSINNPSNRPDAATKTQTSTLLPYPFSYIYHYNGSGYPTGYYQSNPYYNSYYNPWAQAEYSRYRNYPQSYYAQYYAPYPSYASVNFDASPKEDSSELKSSDNDLLDSLIKSSKEKKNSLPDWQTEPLSEKVLEEVRAHLNDKPKLLLPTSLKNTLKLERIGKLIKLDELTRKRRNIINDVKENDNYEINEEELETYVEKTTCENITEVGYFSFGNMSQPYPDCCPQKIETIHTVPKVVINSNN